MKTLKKVLSLFFISLVLVVTMCGCSTESDNSSEVEKPRADVSGGTGIEGTWEGTATITEGNSEENVVLALNSDSTYTMYVATGTSESPTDEILFDGDYKVEGDELTLTSNTEEDNAQVSTKPGTFTYKLNNNNLTLTSDSGQSIYFTRLEEEGTPTGDETTN